MKKKSLIFKEQRNAVWKQIVALRKKSEDAESDFTEDELLELRTKEKEYDGFADKILDAEKHEAREAEQVAREMAAEQEAEKEQRNKGGKNPKKTPEARAVERFSFIKAIRQARNGEALDGIEKEMYDEAMNEAKEIGLEIRGSVAVPASFMNAEKRTTLTSATPATAGNLIETNLGSLIEALRPNLVMDSMGITRLSGLVGNLEMPRKTKVSTATWVGEGVQSPESNPEFDKIALSPKRLTSTTIMSDHLLRQASLDVEAMVRQELSMAIAEKLDETLITGSGTGNIPLGILNIPGIGLVSLGTNGAALTWNDVVKLASTIDDKNALMGSTGYLMNPLTRGTLRTTKKDAGSGLFLMDMNNELAGYRTGTSTHIPKTLTKGTGTNLSALIFGNFADFILASWGGVSMIVDPYSKKREAEVEVTIHSYHDTDFRHAESFSAALDVITN